VTGRAWLRLAVVIVATTVLQVGVLNGLEVDGAHPDGFLLVAIAAGIVAAPSAAPSSPSSSDSWPTSLC
jgi:hypothetical protein